MVTFICQPYSLESSFRKALSLETKSIPFCSGDWADDAAQQNHDAQSTVRGTAVSECTVLQLRMRDRLLVTHAPNCHVTFFHARGTTYTTQFRKFRNVLATYVVLPQDSPRSY